MYRKNVCVVIFNEDLNFLACQRLHQKEYQFVQGGIESKDDGDNVLNAAYREVREEIGLERYALSFVAEIPPPNGDPRAFRYTLRDGANLRRFGYIGQEQRLLLFFTPAQNIHKMSVIPPPDTDALQEFARVVWMPIEEIVERCPAEKRHIFHAVATLAPPLARAFLQKKDSAL
ncbi:putative NUDIX hydrolase, conserved [Trypanosoma theileri]|uniref:Putative NUDIX hydrolase, conserved n=1 Tax=Trypanosoma theileri TaxID=67003 RepID=A0A1X0P2U2_9TRYP|nr:putative NUDIX hydrolase, conserved [Trypanosoma theileri]ORC91138.1 putative NUDIX hydrolase, conserved [Trypanosoma theileri]